MTGEEPSAPRRFTLPEPVARAASRVGLDAAVGRPVRRHLGSCCGTVGYRRPEAAAAAACLPRKLPRADQVLQHGAALADRRRAQHRPERRDGAADHGARLGGARARRPADRRGAVDHHRRPGALLPRGREARAADHHAALAGLADRLAAGRDLPVRHRRRAGDLHGGGRAVLPHGAGDHQPDRRRQPQPDQRGAHHGRVETADLFARHHPGDPARPADGAAAQSVRRLDGGAGRGIDRRRLRPRAR